MSPRILAVGILLARVRSLLRRSSWMRQASAPAPATDLPPETLTFAGNTLDLAALELRVAGKAYHLTLMEAELLRYFLQNAGKAISRKSILEDVWNLHEDTDTRAIDNFIVRLRRYLEEDATKPKHLLTVRGVGYRFVAEPG